MSAASLSFFFFFFLPVNKHERAIYQALGRSACLGDSPAGPLLAMGVGGLDDVFGHDLWWGRPSLGTDRPGFMLHCPFPGPVASGK